MVKNIRHVSICRLIMRLFFEKGAHCAMTQSNKFIPIEKLPKYTPISHTYLVL